MDEFNSAMILFVSFCLVYMVLYWYVQHRKKVHEQQLQARQKELERQAREARVAAVRQLKDRGIEAVPELLTAAREKVYAVRQAALETLGDIGEAIVPYLLEALRGGDLELRLAAIYAAAQVRHVRLVPDLLIALRDPNQHVSSAAACALGQIGDQSVIPDLLAALNHSVDQNPRWASAWALGQFRVASAVSGILSMLRDASGGEDEFLIGVLVQIGENAVSELVAKLGDPDHQVQSCAANALERIGTPEALDALAAWRNRQKSE